MGKLESKKVVMIAGGSRGIGKYLADNLQYKYAISVCGRSSEDYATEHFMSVACDLTLKKDVNNFVCTTLDKYGRIDAMIYNAGIFPYDDMLEVKERDVDALYNIVIKGYLFVLQSVIPIMREQKKGYIINIGSIRGLTVTPNKTAYSSMKRAAISMTESVSVENEKYGIKSTSIHPSTVDTESSRERYGGNYNHLNLVKEKDILNIIEMLFGLSEYAKIDSIFVDGRL
jgi:NADP-dependent 3-hydroxy acid dehydrogenase YdfG